MIQFFIKAEESLLQPRGFVATNNCNRKIIIQNSLGNCWSDHIACCCHGFLVENEKKFWLKWNWSDFRTISTKRTKAMLLSNLMERKLLKNLQISLSVSPSIFDVWKNLIQFNFFWSFTSICRQENVNVVLCVFPSHWSNNKGV